MLGGQFNAKVHMNGPDQLVVETGGTIILNGGTILPSGGSLPSAITALNIAAVTGVNGTGNNAASKADVDTAFAAVQAAVNSLITAMHGAGLTS